MATLFLQIESNRFYTSIMSIEAIQIGETEKACKFELEGSGSGRVFWLPKSAIKTRKSGIMKGCTVLANWFKFDKRTFNLIKEYIDHSEVTREGFMTTG